MHPSYSGLFGKGAERALPSTLAVYFRIFLP